MNNKIPRELTDTELARFMGGECKIILTKEGHKLEGNCEGVKVVEKKS